MHHAPSILGRVRLGAVLVLLSFPLHGCQSNEVATDRFIRFVDELAYGGGTDGARVRVSKLKKWVGPLIWSFEGSPRFGKSILRHMTLISKITGTANRFDGQDAAITFLQENKPGGYPVNQDLTDCYVTLRHEGNRIVSATVRIASRQPERLAKCIPHEIIHILGYRFHSGAISSIMSPLHGRKSMSKWDAMAIRLLMSDEIEPGQSSSAFRAEAERKLPTLRSWGRKFDLELPGSPIRRQ